MKRLTTKSKNIEDMYLCDIHNVQEAIDKLGLFEDFIEEQGFEDLEDLKRYIELSIKSSEIIAKKRQEIRVLKDMWGKLKEIISNKQHIKDTRNSAHVFNRTKKVENAFSN